MVSPKSEKRKKRMNLAWKCNLTILNDQSSVMVKAMSLLLNFKTI